MREWTVEEILEDIAPLEKEIEPLDEKTMAMVKRLEAATKDRSHPVIKTMIEMGYKDTKEAHKDLEIGKKDQAELVKRLEGVELSLTPYDIVSIYSHICEVSEGIAGLASGMLGTIISAYICKDLEPELREKAILGSYCPESISDCCYSDREEVKESNRKRVEETLGISVSEVEEKYEKAGIAKKRDVRGKLKEELHAKWEVLYEYCLGEILPYKAELLEVVGIKMPWEEAVSLVTERQAEYKKKLDKVVPEELQERIHEVEKQLHHTLSAYLC